MRLITARSKRNKSTYSQDELNVITGGENRDVVTEIEIEVFTEMRDQGFPSWR
jgi:hypothetical protein